MSLVACAPPMLDHLTLREALRLCATCGELRGTIHPMLMSWIARYKCRCEWMRGVRLSTYLPPRRSTFIAFVDASTAQRGSYLYHPRVPSHRNVMHQLNHALCRECLAPCKAIVRATSGRNVIVCKSCTLDCHSYSALINRTEARRMLRGRVFNVEKALRRLPVAKLGGNRARLYWKHALLRATSR